MSDKKLVAYGRIAPKNSEEKGAVTIATVHDRNPFDDPVFENTCKNCGLTKNVRRGSVEFHLCDDCKEEFCYHCWLEHYEDDCLLGQKAKMLAGAVKMMRKGMVWP